MTRLVIDTASAPAWEPGASVEVRLIAPDIEHTVTGTLVAARSPADPSPEPQDLVLGTCPECGAQGMVERGTTVEHTAAPTAGGGGMAERIAALPTVTISPARRNGSTRGATRRKAVFLDDVLAALAPVAHRPTPAEPDR